jgi:predicted transcriptional regulator
MLGQGCVSQEWGKFLWMAVEKRRAEWPPAGHLIGIGDWGSPAYNIAMEISLAPEIEARLAKIASDAGKAANQVVQELVASYVDHDEWFKREVQKGLDSLDGGKSVSHEEVGRRIEHILRP